MWVVVQEAIRAATLVVIPARPGFFDLNAVRETVATARERGRPYAVVLNATPLRRDDKEAPVVAQSRAFLQKPWRSRSGPARSASAPACRHACRRFERHRVEPDSAAAAPRSPACGRRSSARWRRSTPRTRAARRRWAGSAGVTGGVGCSRCCLGFGRAPPQPISRDQSNHVVAQVGCGGRIFISVQTVCEAPEGPAFLRFGPRHRSANASSAFRNASSTSSPAAESREDRETNSGGLVGPASSTMAT